MSQLRRRLFLIGLVVLCSGCGEGSAQVYVHADLKQLAGDVSADARSAEFIRAEPKLDARVVLVAGAPSLSVTAVAGHLTQIATRLRGPVGVASEWVPLTWIHLAESPEQAVALARAAWPEQPEVAAAFGAISNVGDLMGIGRRRAGLSPPALSDRSDDTRWRVRPDSLAIERVRKWLSSHARGTCLVQVSASRARYGGEFRKLLGRHATIQTVVVGSSSESPSRWIRFGEDVSVAPAPPPVRAPPETNAPWVRGESKERDRGLPDQLPSQDGDVLSGHRTPLILRAVRRYEQLTKSILQGGSSVQPAPRGVPSQIANCDVCVVAERHDRSYAAHVARALIAGVRQSGRPSALVLEAIPFDCQPLLSPHSEQVPMRWLLERVDGWPVRHLADSIAEVQALGADLLAGGGLAPLYTLPAGPDSQRRPVDVHIQAFAGDSSWFSWPNVLMQHRISEWLRDREGGVVVLCGAAHVFGNGGVVERSRRERLSVCVVVADIPHVERAIATKFTSEEMMHDWIRIDDGVWRPPTQWVFPTGARSPK